MVNPIIETGADNYDKSHISIFYLPPHPQHMKQHPHPTGFQAHLPTPHVSFPRKGDTKGERRQSMRIKNLDPRFRGDDTVTRGDLKSSGDPRKN